MLMLEIVGSEMYKPGATCALFTGSQSCFVAFGAVCDVVT